MNNLPGNKTNKTVTQQNLLSQCKLRIYLFIRSGQNLAEKISNFK